MRLAEAAIAWTGCLALGVVAAPAPMPVGPEPAFMAAVINLPKGGESGTTAGNKPLTPQRQKENEEVEHWLKGVEEEFTNWFKPLNESLIEAAKIMDKYMYTYGYPGGKVPFARLSKSVEMWPVSENEFARDIVKLSSLEKAIHAALPQPASFKPPEERLQSPRDGSMDYWDVDKLTQKYWNPFSRATKYYKRLNMPTEVAATAAKAKDINVKLTEMHMFEKQHRRVWWSMGDFRHKLTLTMYKTTFMVRMKGMRSRYRQDTDDDWSNWAEGLVMATNKTKTRTDDISVTLNAYDRGLLHTFITLLQKAIWLEYFEPTPEDIQSQKRKKNLADANPHPDPQPAAPQPGAAGAPAAAPQRWPPLLDYMWSDEQKETKWPEAAADPRWIKLEDFLWNIRKEGEGHKAIEFPVKLIRESGGVNVHNPSLSRKGATFTITHMLNRVQNTYWIEYQAHITSREAATFGNKDKTLAKMKQNKEALPDIPVADPIPVVAPEENAEPIVDAGAGNDMIFNPEIDKDFVIDYNTRLRRQTIDLDGPLPDKKLTAGASSKPKATIYKKRPTIDLRT